MSAQADKDDKRWIIFFSAAVALGAVLRFGLFSISHWTIGDAFIEFRFGEQFAAGHGLVFNAGERVSCNTTLLHTLILGLAGSVHLPIPIFARALGIACDAASAFMMLSLVKSSGFVRSRPVQHMLPLALYFYPLLAMYAVSGMETSLFVCLIFFLLVRTLKGPDWKYYVAAALVLLCRPDGVMAIAGSALFLTLDKRKIDWFLVGWLALIGLAYVALNYGYYGTIIPQSVRAKAIFYHNTKYENFHFVAMRFFRGDLAFAGYIAVAIACGFALRKSATCRLIGMMSAALFLFVLGLAPGLRSYYVVPSLYVTGIAIAIAAGRTLEARFQSILKPILVCVTLSYVAAVGMVDRLVVRELTRAEKGQDATIKVPGVWIRDHTPPNARVFVTALEVGYYSKRYTLDSPGLATPRVLDAIKKNPRLSLFEQADVVSADYALIPEEAGPPPANYQLIEKYRSPVSSSEYQAMRYNLYKRKTAT
jgi:hypothetical protein